TAPYSSSPVPRPTLYRGYANGQQVSACPAIASGGRSRADPRSSLRLLLAVTGALVAHVARRILMTLGGLAGLALLRIRARLGLRRLLVARVRASGVGARLVARLDVVRVGTARLARGPRHMGRSRRVGLHRPGVVRFLRGAGTGRKGHSHEHRCDHGGREERQSDRSYSVHGNHLLSRCPLPRYGPPVRWL